MSNEEQFASRKYQRSQAISLKENMNHSEGPEKSKMGIPIPSLGGLQSPPE
jgi:hypothetical protein